MFAARAIKSELVVATLAGDLDASETTPLLDSRQQAGKPVGTQHGEMLWWLVELLVVVPVPLILMAHIGVLMVTAMNQTITDGGSPSNGKPPSNRYRANLTMMLQYTLWSLC